MRQTFIIVVGWLVYFGVNAQPVSKKLAMAYRQFETDSQLTHATSSLYVINAKTGKVVFDKNSEIGLAPASTLKIVTAVTSFELLGKNYQYKTELGYSGDLNSHILKGNLCITGSGDPTLGSWRFAATTDTIILKAWQSVITGVGIQEIDGDIVAVDNRFETQTTPGGWIWEDIGNYYGAGVSGLNWRENQYDLTLAAGERQGDSVQILGTYPPLENCRLVNELTTGPAGSGDNGYIFLPPYSTMGFVRGTIPLHEKRFVISGSLPIPSHYPVSLLGDMLKKEGIIIRGHWPETNIQYLADHEKITVPDKILQTHYSPPLDSIIFWFLKKSINLYGEALIKTLAYVQKGFGSTDSGIAIVKDFWQQKGIDDGELNIKDGSGLSPQNRVTTHAQVEVLKYARMQPWFQSFFGALPEYNNMKMKSGSIADVKGFCGYYTAGDGTQYIFSFLVNNYVGSGAPLINKMFKVLDTLK